MHALSVGHRLRLSAPPWAAYRLWISAGGPASRSWVFGAWTWRGDRLTERRTKARRTGAAILAVGVAFFLAELGDKTMLATITLATQEGWFGTWLGRTVGMVAANARPSPAAASRSPPAGEGRQ